MGTRLNFQTQLETLLGTRKVYFQSPEKVKMGYPCIVYSISNKKTTYANDFPYSSKTMYSVTVIDTSPASTIADKVEALQLSSFERKYVFDNLHHYVYNVYY